MDIGASIQVVQNQGVGGGSIPVQGQGVGSVPVHGQAVGSVPVHGQGVGSVPVHGQGVDTDQLKALLDFSYQQQMSESPGGAQLHEGMMPQGQLNQGMVSQALGGNQQFNIIQIDKVI